MFRILFICLALASGGVAAWLVGSMGADATSAGGPGTSGEERRTDDVLVAASDVEAGAAVGAEQMRWQSWPAEMAQATFILRADRPEAREELAGSVARSFLVAGSPVLAQSLAPARSSLLSAVLSPGMRAVAIRVSAEKTAGGFILPNDRVDVLLTSPCRPQDGCNAAMGVRTILKNVRVLAIDQADGEQPSETSLVGKTATLELDPVQTETIIGAEASGTLALVLRAAADHADSPDSLEPKSRTVRVMREGVSEHVTLR